MDAMEDGDTALSTTETLAKIDAIAAKSSRWYYTNRVFYSM